MLLRWARRAWQAALHQGQLQKEADVFRLFLCITYFRGAYDGAREFEAHRIPPYEEQKAAVEECITEQLMSMFDRMDAELPALASPDATLDSAGAPFVLHRQKSSVAAAGDGVSVRGYARPGSLVALYPGLVYTPFTARHIPGYPNIDQDNDLLIARPDHVIIDAKGYDTTVSAAANRSLLGKIHGGNSPASYSQGYPHPYALAHLVNHPPAGKSPNVASFSYDYPVSIPEKLRRFIPNRYFKPPGLLYGGDCVMRGLVLIATTHIRDEELFLNYRFNPRRPRPDWYTPLDEEEDLRRWS